MSDLRKKYRFYHCIVIPSGITKAHQPHTPSNDITREPLLKGFSVGTVDLLVRTSLDLLF
jgi:hypothetical protein